MESIQKGDLKEKVEKGNMFNQVENVPKSKEQPTRALDDPEEYAHLREVCASFFNYQVDALREVSRVERDFNSLPDSHKKLLKFDYKTRIERMKKAIWQNYLFLLKIASPYSHMFKFYKSKSGEVLCEPLNVQAKDINKIRSTLKLFIRDWAAEGQHERDTCYKPILEEFSKHFDGKTKSTSGEPLRVLIPGVGLGRLLYEFAKLGFKAQGNEFSYYMLLCSNFILNCTSGKEEFEIQPLIHTFSNIFWEDAPFKSFKVPDVCLQEELGHSEGEMSMVAGEFVEVYQQKLSCFDGIATCFFLDTGHNIIDYIVTIHKILKPGALWVNFGPLLYHYSDMEKEVSIELSWEDVRAIIVETGFEIRNEEVRESLYSSDPDSMLKTVFRCTFFTAVKLE